MKKSRFFIVATLAIILIIGISSCSNPSDDTKLVRDQTELEKITESKEDFATTKSYMGGSNQLDDITNENSALEQEDGMEHSSDTEGKDSRNITNTDGNQEVSSYNEKDNKIHDDEDPRKISNKELSNFIVKYHEVFNGITSNEKYKNIDWDNMKSTKESMSSEIEQFLNNQDSYPPSMGLDFERIIQLAEISLKNYDSTPVVYIHRILHDLDIEYNKYTPNNKYGFSNYDGGGENQLTISDYIEGHKN